MTTRILPAEEWPRLTGTLLEHAWPHFDPVTTRVVVVEDGAALVGCVALFQAWHLDGAWIAPASRQRVSVLRRGLRLLRRVLDEQRVPEVVAMATTASGKALCERFGKAMRLQCAHFALARRGSTWE